MKTKFKILAAFLLTFAIILSVALIGAAEDPSETKLTNEFYHSYKSTSADVGSIGGRWKGVVGCDETKDSGIINNNIKLYDGSSYLKIQGTGLVRAASNYFQYLMNTPYKFSESTDADYIILEYDIATEGKLANNFYYAFRSVNSSNGNSESEKTTLTQSGENITVSAGGMSFQISGKPHEWTHITMIVEITDPTNANSTSSPIHYYANGVYKGTVETATPIGASGAVSLTGIRMYQGMTSKVMNEDETVLFDNISMTLYSKNSEDEGSLAYVLAEKESRNLSEWTAGMWKSDYSFPPSDVAAAIGTTPYTSFQEAYDAWVEGDVINIYQDVNEPFEVIKPIKVDTHGYTFNYFSDVLILKEVNGNEITFGEGQIEVEFFDAKGVLIGSEVYSSARKVTVPAEVLEKMPEHISYGINENGSAFIIVTDGWKKVQTEGAPHFDANDLGFATPDNCTFYLNSYSVTSAIAVIDANGTLTEYEDGNLAAAINAINTESAMVMLNSNIALLSPVVITKNVTIDFNTYSITYDGIHTMFTVRGGGLDLEGPGSINKTSKSSYVFDVEDGVQADVKINDVDILSSTIVANVQSGSLSVSNSIIKVEGGDAVDAIVVKNADVAVENSTIELEASDENSYAIKAEGANVTLTGATLSSNAGGLATDENSSASLEEGTKVKAETAFGGETGNVTLTEGVQISTNNGTENIPLPENTVFAYTENPDVPYVLTSDYIVVTWKIGEFELVENWVRGAKPYYKDASVDTELNAYQENNTDKTKMYAFSVSRAYENITFEPQLVDIIAPMYNVEVGINFNFNIYVPTVQFGAKTASILIGEEALDITKLAKKTIGETEYYVITIESITPSAAAEAIEYKVSFTYDGDDTSYSLTFNASIAKYCDAILTTGEENYDAQTLYTVELLLNYIDKAYKYLGKTNADLTAIIAKHEIAFDAYEYGDEYESATSFGENAAGKFESAKFVYDENGARYEFVIAEGFSGRIKIMQYDEVVVYNVTNGKINGSNVITYIPDTDSFFDPISVQFNKFTVNNSNEKIFVYDIFDFVANESNDTKTQEFADAFVYWVLDISELPVID